MDLDEVWLVSFDREGILAACIPILLLSVKGVGLLTPRVQN